MKVQDMIHLYKEFFFWVDYTYVSENSTLYMHHILSTLCNDRMLSVVSKCYFGEYCRHLELEKLWRDVYRGSTWGEAEPEMGLKGK